MQVPHAFLVGAFFAPISAATSLASPTARCLQEAQGALALLECEAFD